MLRVPIPTSYPATYPAAKPPTSSDQVWRSPGGVHPLLVDIADEGRALFVRLLAYLCGLAILALIAADLLLGRPTGVTIAPPAPAGWAAASRPYPAFSASSEYFPNKSESYEVLRHPAGGRKDTLRWTADGDRAPVAEIEIYRAGDEMPAFAAPGADLAQRMGLDPTKQPEPAGLVETKFGKLTLWSLPGTTPACLGFAGAFDSPRLRISGWSCQADSRSLQRSLIGCAVDRLILLNAGNDPKLAELFARAELKRVNCAAAPAISADWVSSNEAPQLRGRLF
jgi:hypothetical protein